MNAVKKLASPAVATVTAAPSGEGVDILILTEDDVFLMEARRAVKLPNRVWHATSDTQAADMLMSRPCAAALLDIGLLSTRLKKVLGRLQQQFPDLGIVLTGNAEDAPLAKPLVGAGAAEKFVLKAQAAAHLAGALEAGIDRHLEVRTAEQRRKAAFRRRLRVIAGSVTAIALAGAAVWFGMTHQHAVERAVEAIQPRVPPVRQPVEAPQPVDELAGVTDPKLRDLLKLTNERVQQDRLLEPARDNAKYYLNAARKLDAGHPQVKRILNGLVMVMMNKSDQAAARSEFDSAEKWLNEAKALKGEGVDFSRSENILRIARQMAAQ